MSVIVVYIIYKANMNQVQSKTTTMYQERLQIRHLTKADKSANDIFSGVRCLV